MDLVHSPSPHSLPFMPGVPCHTQLLKASLPLYIPSRHWGGCYVPLMLSLLQAGQAPLPQALGQCSQDSLKCCEMWG